MRLTDHTDYALRVLLFCAARPDRLVTIAEIASAHQLSKNHLMKIASGLSRLGLIEAIRGRNGGLRLARTAEQIAVGEVIRSTEPDLRLVECFDQLSTRCCMTGNCRIETALREALQAYFDVLDKVSLKDLTTPIDRIAPIFLARTNKLGYQSNEEII